MDVGRGWRWAPGLIFEQTGGPPPALEPPVQEELRVEVQTARCGRYGPGQLVLREREPLYMGTVRQQNQ